MSAVEIHTDIQGTPDAPLVLLVHGRGGNINIMKIFQRSLPEGWNVMFVQAPFPDEDIGGFSWWDATRSPLPWEQIEQASELFLDSYNKALSAHELSPQKIVGIGFSQGSAMLCYLNFSEQLKFNQVAILAGFALFPQDYDSSTKIDTSFFWAHGTQDEIIPYSRAERGQQRLQELSLELHTVKEDVGHKIGTNGMRELKEWLV